jgi:hypothetical protein
MEVAPQLRAPVSAIVNTRGARGVQTSRRVWRYAQDDQGVAVQFALCAQTGYTDRPPLGWTLTRATIAAIAADVADAFLETDSYNACRQANRVALRTLRAALAPRP